MRVNCVAPGVFQSEVMADSNKSSLQGVCEENGLPAERAGCDEGMAAAVLYLAGKGGLFLNNQVCTYFYRCYGRLAMAFTIGILSRWW